MKQVLKIIEKLIFKKGTCSLDHHHQRLQRVGSPFE